MPKTVPYRLSKERQAKEKYRKRHKEAGLCVDCPRPVFNGSVRCQFHLFRNAKHHRNYSLRHKERRRIKKYLS